jgi:3-isopropylmalate/(R)-2-methylmalate dehydratase small subunit
MEGADPDFSKKVRPGDILVAGRNFGSGSSRETAPLVIKHSGVSVVIAEFFARIFYRNAINIGLKVLICGQASEISDGDDLEVEPGAGLIRNLSSGLEYTCAALPDHILALVEDGGLAPHLEKIIRAERSGR